MKIAVCGSMIFSEKMLEVKDALEKMGHTVVVSRFAALYAGKPDAEKLRLTVLDKNESDAIREFYAAIEQSDAVLVLNYDRKGVKNYIGGNTLMELGFAHVLRKKIFLLNDVPAIDFYESEIIAVKPVVINGDLSRIG